MTHFNQPHVVSSLGKFRVDDNSGSGGGASSTSTGTMHNNKYNISSATGVSTTASAGNSLASHVTQQYTTVPYTQQSTDDKRGIYLTQSTTGATNAVISSVQPPELSQDLCNAILQQQNDAKRGNLEVRIMK